MSCGGGFSAFLARLRLAAGRRVDPANVRRAVRRLERIGHLERGPTRGRVNTTASSSPRGPLRVARQGWAPTRSPAPRYETLAGYPCISALARKGSLRDGQVETRRHQTSASANVTDCGVVVSGKGVYGGLAIRALDMALPADNFTTTIFPRRKAFWRALHPQGASGSLFSFYLPSQLAGRPCRFA